jgi:C4-type Zn-finger protein
MKEKELFKANEDYNLALAQCGEVLGNGLAMKVADKECPNCSAQMQTSVVPSAAIIYVYQTCVKCNYKRKDFI